MKYKYKVSDSFRASHPFDANVRELHLMSNNKCRSYALFKSQVFKHAGGLLERNL